MKKHIFSAVTAGVLAVFCGCGGNGNTSTPTTITGAAADDYIVNGDVTIYNLQGKKITECKTGDFGIYNCKANVSPNEKVIIIVKNGYVDTDGNLSTADDEIPFDGSLAAVGEVNESVIVSPFTSKIVADILGIPVTIDKNDNLSYINSPIEINGTKIQNSFMQMLKAEQNLPAPHILNTKNSDIIKQQTKTVMRLLDRNITAVNDINADSSNFRLQILHINDTHSHLEPTQISIYINGKKTYVYAGGYAKIAKFIKDVKNSDSHAIALHAGDAVQGTLYYNLFDGRADVEALNLMDLDAMTIGNHEFDKNATTFGKDFASLADFPIISCDINASANPILKSIIKPYIIKNIDGEKVAVVGDSIDSSVISNPGPTIVFSNYITSAQKYVNELEKQGINKIIFLTHIGYDDDKILAEQVPDIDVIVGGHSHTLLGNFSNLGMQSSGPYPTVIDHNSSKTLVVTDYKWGEMVGDLNIVFDKNGKIKSWNGTPVMLVSDTFLQKNANGEKTEVNSSVKNKIENFISIQQNIKTESDDQAVDNIINKFKPQVDKLMNTVIGSASEDLLNVRLPGGTDPDTNTTLPHGSMIAPVVAKAMYEKAKETVGCDFALQNAGGVRISIPQGNITIGEVYTLLPFGNTLVILNLKGSTIKTMLENAIDRSLIQQTDTGAFPYMYNAKITINKDNAKGNRITSFKIKDAEGNWVDLDPDKTYKIATNSYIAGGGDYYTEMKEATDKLDTGFVDAEIFMEYVKNNGSIDKLPEDETPVTLQ